MQRRSVGNGMNRKKLVDDVTIQEMRTLRDKGFSNQQIAEQLDCSYASVLGYLGKANFRAIYKPKTIEPGIQNDQEDELDKYSVRISLPPELMQDFVTLSEVHTKIMGNDKWQYIINMVTKEITISNGFDKPPMLCVSDIPIMLYDLLRIFKEVEQ
jgi:hypothetical protein